MCPSGGEEVLLDVGGQDATEAFEDVGHSDEAREILDGLLVGKLKRRVRRLLSLPCSTLHGLLLRTPFGLVPRRFFAASERFRCAENFLGSIEIRRETRPRRMEMSVTTILTT